MCVVVQLLFAVYLFIISQCIIELKPVFTQNLIKKQLNKAKTFSMKPVQFFFLLLLSAFCTFLTNAANSDCSKNILFIPLDERFTTRDAFLNLAQTTPFCIMTPETEMLSSLKDPANINEIHQWIDDRIGVADAMIISAEMYLYGGLIASRISNESTSVVMSRVEKLLHYSDKYPNLNVYVSNVVMRIPAYDGDFEEPWYWADYGYDLYTYSFYLDKYTQLNQTIDLITAEKAIAGVPSSAVEEFTWRRDRNHNVTMRMLQALNSNPRPPFQYFYTTLDDSAEYGFNIREADVIRNFVSSVGLSAETCPVYPGADEVHLTMLAKFCTNEVHYGSHRLSAEEKGEYAKRVHLATIFRDPSSITSIPGYEGQPMLDTLTQQVRAAGGVLVPLNSELESIAEGEERGGFSLAHELRNAFSSGRQYAALTFLLVNNFSGDEQAEASQQPLEGNSTAYSIFNDAIDFALKSQDNIIPVGFCDNRYANGADKFFVEYMSSQTANLSGLQWTTYAGWNTNGNTIGTVVANTILLALFGHDSDEIRQANAAFNSLRILEDMSYQADWRQALVTYADSISNTDESSRYLTPDLEFYKQYMFKVLSARYADIGKSYNLPWSLESAYYPWNRTFEIGLTLTK